MGCLFAILGAFAPRLAFLILWIFTPVVNHVYGTWIFPTLGIIFLPFTTLLYTLVAYPMGPANFWGWLVVFFGFLIDLRGYVDAYTYRSSLAISR
jgi:hypothetical protein